MATNVNAARTKMTRDLANRFQFTVAIATARHPVRFITEEEAVELGEAGSQPSVFGSDGKDGDASTAVFMASFSFRVRKGRGTGSLPRRSRCGGKLVR